jgi:hypothetical protein
MGWSPEEIDKHLLDGCTLRDAIAKTDPNTLKALRNKRTRYAIKRCLAAQPLVEWANKWRLESFLNEAGPYELRITKTSNPFYPLYAFNASLEACLDLGVACTEDKLAHAIAFEVVRKCGGRATKARVDEELAKRNVAHVNVVECKPFDMSSHPLRDVDLETTPPYVAMEKAGPEWGGVAAIREKKIMRNDLVLVDGEYSRKRNVTPLAKHIVKLMRKSN